MKKSKVGVRSGLVIRATATAVVASVLPCAPALSDDSPDLLKDPFFLSLGGYLVNVDTRVRVDGKGGEQGTPIDWNRTFGGGDVTRFRVDGQWRFADRHKLRALWFSSDRGSSRTLDREIDWGDETFPVGAKVKSNIKYDIYELAYEYAFFKRETYEVSASLGAYYARWDANLSATITNPDGTNQRNASGDANLDAPLPVLGLRGQWVFPYNLSLDVSGQWFALSVNQYSGNLQDYRGTLTWQPKSWLGIGLGYDWFSVHGDADSSGFKGNLDVTFQGPMLYYSVSF